MAELAICVCGGRDFNDVEFVHTKISGIVTPYLRYDEDTAITLHTGACRGVDQLAERYAHDNRWQIESHPPDYKAFPANPRYAPLARNEEMAKLCDVVIAFWNYDSHGTAHMIQEALNNRCELHVVRTDYLSYGQTQKLI